MSSTRTPPTGPGDRARRGGPGPSTALLTTTPTHRNAALRLPFKHPWLFLLDADERPTPELADEMQRTSATRRLRDQTPSPAFALRRRDYLFGTWLKHAQISPYYIRLVRPERAKYTRAINEVLEVDGPVGQLLHALDHYPFSKGIAHWIAKHNTYSTMEAELIFRQQGLQQSEPARRSYRLRLPHAAAASEGALLPPAGTAADQMVLHDVPARRNVGRRGRRYLCHAPVHL